MTIYVRSARVKRGPREVVNLVQSCSTRLPSISRSAASSAASPPLHRGGCVSDNKQTGSAAMRAADPIFKCNNNCTSGARRAEGDGGARIFPSLITRAGQTRARASHYIARPDAIKREIAVIPTPDGGRSPLRGETGGNSMPAARNGPPDILHGSRVSPSPRLPRLLSPSPSLSARFAVRRRALLLTREAPAAPIPSASTAACPSRSVSIYWLDRSNSFPVVLPSSPDRISTARICHSENSGNNDSVCLTRKIALNCKL